MRWKKNNEPRRVISAYWYWYFRNFYHLCQVEYYSLLTHKSLSSCYARMRPCLWHIDVVGRFLSSALSSALWTRQLIKADVSFIVTVSDCLYTTRSGLFYSLIYLFIVNQTAWPVKNSRVKFSIGMFFSDTLEHFGCLKSEDGKFVKSFDWFEVTTL